jgi:hypothetical protein
MALTTFIAYSSVPGEIGFYLAHDTLNFTSDITVAATPPIPAFKSVAETEQTYTFSRLLEDTSYSYSGTVYFEDGTTQALSGSVLTKSMTPTKPVATKVVSATTVESNLFSAYPEFVIPSLGKRVTLEAAAAGVLVRFNLADDFIPLAASTPYIFGGVSNIYYKSGGAVNLSIIFDNLTTR